MSWEYHCPKCQAMLNPEHSVILVVEHGDVRAIVGLHPQPGKFEVYLPPGMTAPPGTKWDFSCPACSALLANGTNPNLCELDLRVGEEMLRILFSSVAGELATFLVGDGQLKEKHGKDTDLYDLHWGQIKYLV